MKREIIITVLLIILVITLILSMKFVGSNFEQSDAKKFVVEDLRVRFPKADKIEVITFTEKLNDAGVPYYAIKASVSEKLETPCPTKTHYYYNYPEQNFVPAPPEYVVKNCKVCESTLCIIAFEEEAIIASHILENTNTVRNYIIAHSDALPNAVRVENGWKVIWKSSAEYGYIVRVTDTGIIQSAETCNKSEC